MIFESCVPAEPSFHRKVYGAVPPLATISALPFVPPKQVASVGVSVPATAEGSETIAVVISVHPLLSVTVTS